MTPQRDLLFQFQVARRSLHRPVVVFRMPNLLVLDGIPISDEEKVKVDFFQQDMQVREYIWKVRAPNLWTYTTAMFSCFLHCVQQVPVGTTIENIPCLAQAKPQVSVKVTNMQLLSGQGIHDKNWAGTVHYAEDPLQTDGQRSMELCLFAFVVVLNLPLVWSFKVIDFPQSMILQLHSNQSFPCDPSGRKKNLAHADPMQVKVVGTTQGVPGMYATRTQHQVAYVPQPQGGNHAGGSDSLTRYIHCLFAILNY